MTVPPVTVPSASRSAVRPAPHRDGRSPLVPLAAILVLAAAGAASAATLEIHGPAGTAVSIDGRDLGLLPLAPLDVERGSYRVECRLAGHQRYVEVVEIGQAYSESRLQVRLMPFERRTALLGSLLLAGWGQRYLERPYSGWALTVAEAGGLLAALWGEVQFTNHKDDFRIARDAYDNAVSGSDTELYEREARDAYARMDDDRQLRRTGLLVAGGAVAVSLLDAWLRFPSVETGRGTAPATAGLFDTGTSDGWHAGWCLSF